MGRAVGVLVASLLCATVLAGAGCEFIDVDSIYLHPPRGDSRLDIPQSPPTPKWSPNGDHIVFSTVEGGPDIYDATSIYVAASDGSSLRRITSDNAYHFTPDISPDNSRLVYVTARHEYKDDDRNDFEIETSRLDGSDRRRLTNNKAQDISPIWSPDGNRIAFVRDGIYTMAADGSDVRLVLPSVWRDPQKLESASGEYVVSRYPMPGLTWSPDGQTLAFTAQEGVSERDSVGNNLQRAALYTIGADGTGLTQLYATAAGDLSRSHWMYGHPAWSPDGRELAFFVQTFTEEGGRVVRLHVIAFDGSDLRELAEMEPHNYPVSGRLAWSPDGSRLLFTMRPSSTWHTFYDITRTLYTANADGSGFQAIGEGYYVSWSPDGSRIAILNLYRQGDGKSNVLLSTALDGSDVRILIRKDGGYGLRAASAKCILSFCW